MTPLFTMAGVVSTASHGSGRKFPPVADYVIAMEYVDEKGEIQYVDDPEELDATAGSYGLFGIIISLTFKLDKMVYAAVNKERISVPMEEYIPRPGQPLTEKMIGLLKVNQKILPPTSFFLLLY